MEASEHPEEWCRALTVPGVGVALAMLRGHKRCELRDSKHYPAGY